MWRKLCLNLFSKLFIFVDILNNVLSFLNVDINYWIKEYGVKIYKYEYKLILLVYDIMVFWFLFDGMEYIFWIV